MRDAATRLGQTPAFFAGHPRGFRSGALHRGKAAAPKRPHRVWYEAPGFWLERAPGRVFRDQFVVAGDFESAMVSVIARRDVIPLDGAGRGCWRAGIAASPRLPKTTISVVSCSFLMM